MQRQSERSILLQHLRYLKIPQISASLIIQATKRPCNEKMSLKT